MGDYDVQIPCDTEDGEYRIRVGRFEDDALFGCSDKFEIEGKDTDRDGDSSEDDDLSMAYRML